MTEQHKVLLVDTARDYYKGLLREVQNGTISRDLIGQLKRIRSIISDLRHPQSHKNDPRLINALAWMCCRFLENTHVYYVRQSTTGAVVVLSICEIESDEAYPAFASLILSGNTGVLATLGIEPPPSSGGFSVQ